MTPPPARRPSAAPTPPARLAIDPRDRAVLALLVYAAFALVAMEYAFLPRRTTHLFPEFWQRVAPAFAWGTLADAGRAGVPPGPWWGTLLPFAWWAGGMLLLWVAVPRWLLARTGADAFSVLPPREPRAFGVYGLMLLLMLPVLVVASGLPGFTRTYPMLHPYQANGWSWTLLLLFWLCYATILFSTEYFFRGVLIAALAPRLGVLAVAVSTIPYAMIHLHKPAPEAFASIGAGLLLGYFALVTRSIGGGVLVHVCVAIAMDLLALLRTGQFPVRLLP